MPVKTLTRKHKAATLVPLAVMSGLWTASLATGAATAAKDVEPQAVLPSVPTEAIEEPANVSTDGVIAPGIPAGAADSVVDAASISGIPSAALSAYQRAAQVIDSADAACNIGWELIAAIGRVESDHGRYGGNVLTASGLVEPGIYGIPLDGRNGTAEIRDTDGGQLDQDPVYDRAVGPMQFIPSTWNVVKVDADGDGERDPQNINDAALATAVYLCSGNEDLGTDAGQRSAIFRYNRSQEYVDLVMRIAAAYAAGEYSSVPTTSFGGQLLSPDLDAQIKEARAAAKKAQAKKKQNGSKNSGTRPGNGSGGNTGGGGGSTGGDGGTGGGILPGVGGGSGGGTGGGGGAGGEVADGVGDVVDGVGDAVDDVVGGVGDVAGGATGGATDPITEPVEEVVTRTLAITRCAARGILIDNPLTRRVNELEECIRDEMS